MVRRGAQASDHRAGTDARSVSEGMIVMEQIIPITTLFLGALLVSLAPRLLSRRLAVVTAQALALSGIALGLALIPVSWQTWLAGGEAGDRVLTFAREL